MKIHIVRHTSVNVPSGTYYGQTNVPLNDTFEQEAEVVKQKLKDLTPDVVYSSPLSRCRKLAKYCGFDEIRYHDRLKELYFGDWEMRHDDDIPQEEWDEWVKDKANNNIPEGESFADMYKRVASFYDELKAEKYKEVIIFAHGGVIQCTRAYFGLAKLDDAFENMVEYGDVLEFEL